MALIMDKVYGEDKNCSRSDMIFKIWTEISMDKEKVVPSSIQSG
jgi:hypothetical protein